jgi:hypothetical protein
MKKNWREAMLPENCYFCHLFQVFEFTSVQVYKSSSMLVNEIKVTSYKAMGEWTKKETEKADGKSVTFVTF